jgi:putative ABC transport system permease protein
VPQALKASRTTPGGALAESGRTGSGSRYRSRTRNALVVGEIALALTLLAGAGVIAKEVTRELTQKPGFNPDHLLVDSINLKSPTYKEPAAQAAFFQQTTQKLREISGAESAAASMGLPLSGSWSTSFNIVGHPPLPQSQRPSASYFAVGPGYFRTLAIPLVKGRNFSDTDNAQTPVVPIVSEEFARRFFPKTDAISQQIDVDTGQHKRAQIVGICRKCEPQCGAARSRTAGI